MIALHSRVTSASGRMTHSVIRSDRKVRRHNAETAANSAKFTHLSDCSTTSLVAAITPTLPEARRNVMPPPSLRFLKSSMLATMCLIVVAW